MHCFLIKSKISTNPKPKAMNPILYLWCIFLRSNHPITILMTLAFTILDCGTISEKLIVREDPASYHFINQGCLTVDGMDDREEMRLVEVCNEASDWLK